MSGGIFFDGKNDFKGVVGESESGIVKSDSNQRPERQPFGRRTGASSEKDILIIGGGLAGLSTALHIALNSEPSERRQVTILEREHFSQQKIKTTAASFAAAGMLAPQSERLPTGPLLDLCLASRDMYADFCATVEDLASACHSDAAKYLWRSDDKDGDSPLKPWEVGFTSTGGFLAPAFAGDTVATWAPPEGSGAAHWLDEVQVHELEPHLHPEVIGGWWFPEDASVDARRLTCSLRAACVEAGVQFLSGAEFAAKSLDISDGKCKGVRLQSGKVLSANSVVVANGSWMRDFLPVPITPHKGQSFSLRMPKDKPPILSRVLFAQDTYIVPKPDGKIIVGATVEAGSFDPNVTPAGMMHCMSNAMQLVPGLGDLPLEETWAGLRPTTPDKGPILGHAQYAENLFIAGGYWRNGVLLAPKTGQLLGDLIVGKTLSDQDKTLLKAFSWERFTMKGGGKILAANTRYAASMHPVHKRSKGMGVAAAVGTELGFYSTAASAKEERARDRQAVLSDDGSSLDELFEKAAKLGLEDAETFSMGKEPLFKKQRKVDSKMDDSTDTSETTTTTTYEGSADALTVGASNDTEKDGSDKQVKKHEVGTLGEESDLSSSKLDYDETTFDGYQVIQAANARQTREEELAAMKVARMSNRVKASEINESMIGVQSMPEDLLLTQTNEQGIGELLKEDNEPEKEDLENIYAKIKANKATGTLSTTKNEDESDSRPDPGFRIYQVDEETGEKRLVPPYTSPKEMEKTISSKKSNEQSWSDVLKEDNEPEKEDLENIYAKIKANKATGTLSTTKNEDESDSRPDPGFRIYQVDEETGEKRLVPPYTSPKEMEKTISNEK